MKKDKDVSHLKREAFKSFLDTTSTVKEEVAHKNNSDTEEVCKNLLIKDEEEYTEQSTSCNVCGEEVPEALAKKKFWYLFG